MNALRAGAAGMTCGTRDPAVQPLQSRGVAPAASHLRLDPLIRLAGAASLVNTPKILLLSLAITVALSACKGRDDTAVAPAPAAGEGSQDVASTIARARTSASDSRQKAGIHRLQRWSAETQGQAE